LGTCCGAGRDPPDPNPCYTKLLHDRSDNGDNVGGPNDGATGLLDEAAGRDWPCDSGGWDGDPNACYDWGEFVSGGGCGSGGPSIGGGGGAKPTIKKVDCSQPPAQPPAAPPNVSVDANIGLFHVISDTNAQLYGPVAGHLATNLFLFQMVNTGEPMDYKNTVDQQYVDFGNFNFGAVCQASGDSLYTCQNGAGGAHIYQYLKNKAQGKDSTYGGNGVPVVVPPYGDQSADSAQISAGYNYADSGGALHNAVWDIICVGIKFAF
jgi:hypothetical protein